MCKEKEQKTLKTYQQLAATLKDVSEKTDMINIVHTLTEENGLFPAGESKVLFKTFRKKSESGRDALLCPKCGSNDAVSVKEYFITVMTFFCF